MGVWLVMRMSTKILTTKISSDSPEGYFAKFCTSENIPLYGMLDMGFCGWFYFLSFFLLS